MEMEDLGALVRSRPSPEREDGFTDTNEPNYPGEDRYTELSDIWPFI